MLIFDHPSTSVDTFYVLNMDKNGKFKTTYPPPLVRVVIEWSPTVLWIAPNHLVHV